MMKSILIGLLSVALMTAETPKAESLMDAYVAATGGKEAYHALRTQKMTASVEFVGQGLKGKSITWMDARGNSRTVLELAGAGKIESGVKDGVSWESSAMQGTRIREGEEKEQNARMSQLGAIAQWREFTESAEVVGEEEVEGVTCWKVRSKQKGVSGDGYSWIDQATGLMKKSQMKMKSQMGEIPVETFVREYRKEGGVLMPVVSEQRIGPMTMKTVVESVETNVELPANTFDYPAEVSALLAKKK